MIARKRLIVAALALVVAGAVVWRALRLSTLIHIGAGYVAEQTCACLFVSKRALPSCRGDLEPLAQKIVRIRAGAAEVTASTLGLSTATARYDARFGCGLVD